MELTPQEEKLIIALREIDRRNPAGIDAFTEAAILPALLRMADGIAEDGERRYKAFLEQCRQSGKVIDLREAQREKTAADDPRGRSRSATGP